MIQEKPLAATELERPAMALRTLANGVRLLALPMPHLQARQRGRVPARGLPRRDLHQQQDQPCAGTHGVQRRTRVPCRRSTWMRAAGRGGQRFTGKDITGYFMTGLGWHARPCWE